MKSILQVSFYILLFTQLHYPQWTNQNLVSDGNDLWSTFFVDDNTGWIVGSGGFIKKTTNAGDEWNSQNSGTTSTLKSVQFVNQNMGWICGEGGLILKTTDGGANWHSLASGTTEHLSDIYFYDTNIGFAVGFGGTIIKTTDGGLSWISLPSGTTNNLYSVDFVDAYIGYAAGEVNDTSSVIKTTDGGASWIDKSSGFPVTSGRCLAVEFVDANTGFISNRHTLYRTTDGGDSWNQSKVSFQLIQVEVENSDNVGPYLISEEIHSIFFKDANNGWYIDWRNIDNYIYSTTDGGNTWEYQRNTWERALLSVFVTQGGSGLAVGARGLIYLKAENDSDWSQLLSGSYENIQSIYFVDRNIGWAGGTRWGNPYKGVIYKTTNGGKLWNTQLETSTASYSRCFYFINQSLGWLAKSNSIPQEVGAGIYRTTDGGVNWINVHSAGDYSAVFFMNKDTGWVTSDYSNSTGIYKSTDGGVTLVKKSSVSISSIYFSDFYNGWAVGSGGILKSTDGGETWISKSNLTGSYIKFLDANNGMCVGANILVSTDGGETWSAKSGPTLQTIKLINSTTIWGYTLTGGLYKTTDFGDSWNALNVGLGFGNSAFFFDEYTGWVGGASGTMFNYSVEPSITVTSPNGGEIWKSGSQRNITWTSAYISNVNLYYSPNGGNNWNTIATNIDASSGSYTWTVPNLTWFINLHCKIKIEDASYSSLYDESDNNFIIWHFCNIIQYANLGQRIIDFDETNIDISLNVTSPDNISATYYPYETPSGGSLPSGIVVLSDYYWQVSSSGISFNDGKMIIPISSLRGVTDASKLVWLKRSNSGDDWENIGGSVVGDNLESTVPFISFSEFAIGSTDPINPLPVELFLFESMIVGSSVNLKWITKTETNNFGFNIERRTKDGEWNKIGFVEGSGNSNSPKNYSFTDKDLFAGGNKFEYRLKQIDNDGAFEYSDIVEVTVMPTEYELSQNFPNPFNPSTTIRFSLPTETRLKINIYNMLGELVETLAEGNYEAGYHKVTFNASTLPSGAYIYRIESSEFTQVRKMIFLK